jgi:hypothetical protein
MIWVKHKAMNMYEGELHSPSGGIEFMVPVGWRRER